MYTCSAKTFNLAYFRVEQVATRDLMSQEERIRFVALKHDPNIPITPGHKEEALSTWEGTEFWLVKCRIHSCPCQLTPGAQGMCFYQVRLPATLVEPSLYGNHLCFPPIPRLSMEVTIQQPCLLERMQWSIDLSSLLLSLLGMIHGILSPLCTSAVNQQKLTCIKFQT